MTRQLSLTVVIVIAVMFAVVRSQEPQPTAGLHDAKSVDERDRRVAHARFATVRFT